MALLHKGGLFFVKVLPTLSLEGATGHGYAIILPALPGNIHEPYTTHTRLIHETSRLKVVQNGYKKNNPARNRGVFQWITNPFF